MKADFEDTPQEYMSRVLAEGGTILGMNTIGVVTFITAYGGQLRRDFETVAWVSPALGSISVVDGKVIEHFNAFRIHTPRTLELAQGFHCALARKLWTTAYGKGQAERAAWFKTRDLKHVKEQLDAMFNKPGAGIIHEE